MDVTFVKTPGRRDRVYVVLDDGSERSWAFPSYGPGLPHDLVHLVVESSLGLRRALWGCVADGVDLVRINQHSNGTAGSTDYAGLLGGDPVQLGTAETLAALPWSNGSLEELEEAWDRNAGLMGISDLVPPSAEELAACQAHVAEVGRRWRSIDGKGALRFEVEVLPTGLTVTERPP